MGSNRTGEVNCKIYSEGRDAMTKTKTTATVFSSERNGTNTPSPKSKKSSQTPEYVKRTARLFEAVKITEEIEKNGISETYSSESSYAKEKEEIQKIGKESRKISLDSIDGELNKKPSYVGVSCSNSGYRNVINYDSKLREGFWTANSQRESLVLSSSRLRESSPLRRDFDFKTHNGTNKDSVNITDMRIEKETSTPANGVSQPEKFINISTSTKTISTFRNSKDMKEEELGYNVNEVRSNTDTKVNLKQILNGKNGEPYRKGYSNLGISPRILKSPEKNCNSFLKSINSFENNFKKSQNLRSSTYVKAEQKISSTDSRNSILQRIERLYGPGALAQGFYTQKSNSKTKLFEKSDDSSSDRQVEISSQITKLPKVVSTPVYSTKTSNKLPETTSAEVTQTEICSNGRLAKDLSPDEEEGEKNGQYFLRLLKKETDRLEQLAAFAENELENGENLPEEISGKLRAAAGKAKLLVCQKLHQFEGLCHKNMNEKPGEEFPTTSEDLAGFWDMVMLQVVQVYGVFDELEELKKNNWKATATTKNATPRSVTNGQSQPGKSSSKKSTPTNTVTVKQNQKSESAKKAREEGRRKLLEERRKKMKELKENKIINGENEVEIFAK